MPDLFSRLAARIDVIMVRKMGKTVSINDVDIAVILGEILAELNVLSGPTVSLVVFPLGYHPWHRDRIICDGQQWTVIRHECFDDKLMILTE